VIFSRQRGKAGRHARSKDAAGSAQSGRHVAPRSQADGLATDGFDAEGLDAGGMDAGGMDAGGFRTGSGWNDQTRVVRPVIGPFDVSAAPDDGMQRLDLGALRVPALPDVEVRVEAGTGGHIQQVVLVWGASALQLGAFAAPRSEGVWAEVREDIMSTRIAEGGQAAEINGEYGVELRARVPTPQGPMDLRYVGVDGPRWLVLGIYQGAAADDPAAAGPLRDVFRRLIVVRGDGAMPVREALPLRLPPELAAQAAEQQAAHEAQSAHEVPSANEAPSASWANGANGASGKINGH
jgi:hypothetical protein